MEQTRNGDTTVISYEQELFCHRRRNVTFSPYIDVTREAVNADQARSTASPRCRYADGELDVFAAERYFMGAMDGDHRERSASVAVTVETTATAVRSVVAVSKPGWTCASAASAGSAASVNSQTVLLRDARRRRPAYRGKKYCLPVRVLLRSCAWSQAVPIDGRAVMDAAKSGKPASAGSGTAASAIEWYRDLRMKTNSLGLGLARDGLPPKLNPSAAKVADTGREVTREEKAVEYASASFRRRSFTLQAPVRASGGTGGGGGDDDGGGSDSSSDLFEIKNLKIDDCPYEPSEASIQWSVVTSSAVDVTSSVAAPLSGRGRVPVAAARQQHRDRPVGRLTGCVSRRTLDVSAMAAEGRFPDTPSH